MSYSLNSADLAALDSQGFVHVFGPFARLGEVWDAARRLVNAAAAVDDSFTMLGDYVIPPLDGLPSRDFQTLHFDFGVPLVPAVPNDVARYTALHVPAGAKSGDAATRLVSLDALLAGARWPSREQLIQRFTIYGNRYGARDMAAGYVEGSLARIIEAVLSQAPSLPSVHTHPEFLCGTEFANLEDETEFFAQYGLRPDTVAIEICLRPGELVIFNNLTMAHGRRGTRQPGELRQRVFGHRMLPVHRPVKLRDRLLAAFAT